MVNRVLSTGDLILDIPEPDRFLEPLKETLHAADFAMCQVEVPHTTRGLWSNAEAASAPQSIPESLDVLKDYNFKVSTLAGNHAFDQGYYGVTDTLDRLHSLGIETTGTGANLTEARKPAVYESNGVAFAALSYNCVGPRESWATPLKAGAAFLRVSTAYENELAEPGGPPTSIYTITDPECLRMMCDDIDRAKAQYDVVLVSLHMGRTDSPQILQYQTEIAHAAVEHGASAVFGHHTHVLESIEVYKGVPIYYGLGNFVTLTTCFGPDAPNAAQRAFHPFQGRIAAPNFDRKPYINKGVPYFVFQEEGRLTILADLRFDGKKLSYAGFVPCYINDTAAIEVSPKDAMGQDVYDYIQKKNEANLFGTKMIWSEDGREVRLALD